MTANVLGREMKEKSQPAIVANPKKSRLIVRNLAFKVSLRKNCFRF